MFRLLGRLALVSAVLFALLSTVSVPTVFPSSHYRPAYAVVNARIVPVVGEPIESGTLVMRRGRIAALGADVAAPADAIVVDGSGWTLYPGFIDAHSGIGMPRQPRQPANPFAGGRPQADPTEPSGLNPEASALQLYKTDENALKAARAVGFTAAAAVPQGGVFSGRGTVVALGNGDVQQMVLRDPWAQHIGFERLRGRYPGTTMGVMALIRQRFSDAMWYGESWERYNADPSSLPRPEYDEGLEALRAASTGKETVLFTAWTENEILRALRLASELHLKAVISGATEGWRAADELKASGLPVLVSLDLRPRQRAGGFGGRGGGTMEEPSEADVREAEENAGRLHSAGVPLAFTAAGLEDLSQLLPNLRKAVDAGLPEQAALEALTIQPARLLGVDKALGSLEVGKAAHVVAVAGTLFGQRARVAAVWVDGERYESEAPSRPGRRLAGRPGQGGRAAPQAEQAEESEQPESDSRQQQDRRAPHGPLWPTEPITAIRHATLLTVAQGTIPDGAILIRDGKIAALGRDSEVDIPDGAHQIDAHGMYVMPGIIDAHSHMAISGGGNESSESVTPEVRIGDVIDHRDISLFRALAGGVTTINVLHGSANVIGGQNAVLKLRWGKKAAELFFEGAPRGVKFALGENPKRSNAPARPGVERRYPGTRMGVEYLLRKSFSEAQEYRAAWKDYEAARQRGQDPMPPRRDLRMEALVDILEGRIRVHAHCYRSDEILMLLRVAEDFGFRISSLQHVLEGYKVADEIAAHGAGASTFADNWAYKMEAYDAIPYNMAIMAQRGVTVSVNSDSGERVRRLYVEAAKAVKYGGVAEEEALKMITLNPALHLGIEDRVGSLEVGKDADLAVFTAHPFSAEARVQYTLVDGQVYFDRDRVETAADALRPAETEAVVDKVATGTNGNGNEEQEPEERPGNRRLRSFEDRYADWTAPQSDVSESAPHGYGDAAAPSLDASKGVVAVTGGRILTMAGPPIEKGTVLIVDGLISAVGADVEIPPGAEVIDAQGMTVTPGLINAETALGLTEIGAVAATQDSDEIEDVNSTVKTAVALHPHSEMIPIARANGVTTAVAAPGGGLIQGMSALIDLDGWTPPQLTARSPLAMHIRFPEQGGGRRRFGGGGPGGEARVEEQRRTLREWMRRAQAYAGAMASGALEPTERQMELEALVPVVTGRLPVVLEAGSEEGIRQALKFAADFQLHAILAATRDVWKMVDEIALAGVPVLLGPIESSPPDDDPYDSIFTTAKLLQDAGIPFAFRTGGASNARNLPYHAALSVAFGLGRQAAWHALTRGAAEILGVADLYGTLQPGKIANVVVATGDLLDVPTEVRHVIIRGQPVDLSTRHTRLYEKFRRRPTAN